MKVLNSAQQEIHEKLLKYAGSRRILQKAFRLTFELKRDQATVEDLLNIIRDLKQGRRTRA